MYLLRHPKDRIAIYNVLVRPIGPDLKVLVLAKNAHDACTQSGYPVVGPPLLQLPSLKL